VLRRKRQLHCGEGNQLFPPIRCTKNNSKPKRPHQLCGWKGTAANTTTSKFNGERNPNAAWYYPETKEAANNIAGTSILEGVQIV